MIPPLPDNTTTLVLHRTFNAPRQRVFRAWIEPKAVQHWFKPKGMSVTVSHLDAHVGGSFSFDLENGSSTVGTYLQVDPPEKLSFTWSNDLTHGSETIITLNFFDLGPLTEVVLTQERISTPELRALLAGGWPPLLDALAELLSTHLDL